MRLAKLGAVGVIAGRSVLSSSSTTVLSSNPCLNSGLPETEEEVVLALRGLLNAVIGEL